ncbi:hypothetical protein O1611_g5796 [Lasiodiplodia mahajangana]|uniref:Uncharacterized protein n=1 Tax=Lasiodiplodia mahajangana TaxID=1108764 RepID=A0ACC2JKN2_9PEZI|nr:hypothetical protein O1611_g5796 [Lasiodiplodia mahajangana]
MAGHGVVARDISGHIIVLDAGARACTTALKRTKHGASRSTRPVLEGDIADVKLAGVTLTTSTIVASALGYGEDTRGVDKLEIGQGDVSGVSKASPATVRGVATGNTSPGLEVGSVSHAIVNSHVTNSHVLNRFVSTIVLTDTSQGKPEASVPILVLYENVGAVCLCGDVVVATVDGPVTEGDIVRVDNISSVGVERGEVESDFPLGISAVDVYVLEQNILRVDDGHCPHLGLDKTRLLNDAIFHARVRDLVRATGVVVGTIDEVIPNLAVAIQSTIAKTSPVDVLTAKNPSSGLVLVTDRQRVIEPVGNVGVPQEGTVDLDVDVGQARGVHDTADIVRFVLLEHHSAAFLTSLMTAVTESPFNGIGGIVSARINHAGLGAAGCMTVAGSALDRQGQCREA